MNPALLAALEPAWNIVKAVLGVGGLIFVHELGHFMVGRWSGVRAEAFSIGFGPVLLKWQPGPTEYRLSAIPLGGYVKFLGENPGDDGAHLPDSFPAATYWRKFAIMVAGVTMNVIAAVVLYVAAFSIGVDQPAPEVGYVQPGSAAWEAGLQRGDELVRVDDVELSDFFEFKQHVVLADEIELVVRRDGELLPPLHIEPRADPKGLRRVGIDSPWEIRVDEGSSAYDLGLRTGDEVVAVNGNTVASNAEAMTESVPLGGPLVWTVLRAGALVDLELPTATKGRWVIEIEGDAPRIDAVRRDGAAWAAGLRRGDVPVSVGAYPTPTVKSLRAALAEGRAGAVFVERGGETIEIALGDDAAVRKAVGEQVQPERDDGTFAAPRAGGPMEAAGMLPGSRILRLDGKTVEHFAEIGPLVAEAGDAGRPVNVTWRAPDGTEVGPVEVEPRQTVALELPDGLRVRRKVVEVRADGIADSVRRGFVHTHRTMMTIFATLGSLLSADVSPTALQGPVAIADAAYDSAERGWGQFYLFLGVISMNLAVLNILPIPLLDGGQLMVITAEKVRGEPLPESILAGIQWAGLVFLLGLMAFVITNDLIVKLSS